ncbi:MAG: hypothetical protein DRI46_09380 [Chloroflexi bacterium]|nr:MAG: hypothetical protein DRI46_09380 [Chloroflexota bacterium]
MLVNKFDCTCIECGVEFKARTMFAKCCGTNCRMRKYRRTEKGKAAVIKSNSRYKAPDINKTCIHCNDRFITPRKTQELCSMCSTLHGTYYAQLKFRLGNSQTIRKYGRASKHAARRFYFAECCIIDGCLNEGHRHHPDYDKPHEIVWLCRQHHKDSHTGKGRSIFTNEEIRRDKKDERYYRAHKALG